MIKKISLFVVAVLSLSFSCALSGVLTWTASDGDVTGYKVYYGKNSKEYDGFVTVGNVNEYSIESLLLKENTTYYFAVTAYNSTQESDFSTEVVWPANDQTPPLAPMNLKVE